MRNFIRLALIAYVVLAIGTFLFQIPLRLQKCDNSSECVGGFTKAVVWSAVWPLYYPAYLGAFRPSGG